MVKLRACRLIVVEDRVSIFLRIERELRIHHGESQGLFCGHLLGCGCGCIDCVARTKILCRLGKKRVMEGISRVEP